ncbi:YpmS family protein [Fructobacillus sp. M1-13]|uniref:YpmS family protein n=1 Tax=Fructobacillus papyriferae TaxID=2713171 RepID=A0ABS5QNL7_9LACO|nr:YpmS family protein [Fructobacillus papyriferae]MBS9334723.1 YpmS family protein [Fructobacillus papyriferae]MCD2158713.1 YpmS family protein [Fructobacillus papyriferae]
MKKRRSIWFWLFCLLILAILSAGVYTAYLALMPTRTSFSQTTSGDNTKIDLTLNRDQLNALSNTYLTNQSNGKYSVKVNEENVTAQTTVTVFNQKLDAKLTMVPKTTDGGNVIMEVQKVELGQLDLPVNVAMGYIKEMYTGPKGVTIQPDQKQIALDLSKLTKKNGWTLQADELNLKDNRFTFTGVMQNAQ